MSGETRTQPRVASLVPASALNTRLAPTGSRRGESHWQDDVRRYDLDGPGVAGYYLDLIMLLASLCPLISEVEDNDGQWRQSDDPVLARLLSGYRSPLNPQSDLVGSHVRHLEGMGEAWIIDSEDLGWVVVTVPNVTFVRDAVVWTDPFGRKRITPKNRAWRSWRQDPYSPWLPTSPMRRARDDLRRLKAATRNQTRAAESRLVMNGLVAFPDADASGTRPLADRVEGADTNYVGVDQVVDDYLTLAKAAFADDDHPAAAVPFPYVGPRAEYVELGRGIDQGALEVETKALEAFARSVNFPAQLLTIGPGAANHWNEWLLQESQHKMGLAPKLLPVCADITQFYYRPMIARAKGRIGAWHIDPQRVRVGFDTSYLTSKPDVTAQMLAAWTGGVASREEVAKALNIEELLDIPEGMDEYEHWQLATAKAGAPYAEVENGELVTAPDVFGDGGDAGALPVVDTPPEQPPLEPAPEAPAQLALPLAPPPPAPSGLGAANQQPPAPPAQLAAVGLTPDAKIVQKVLDRLYAADVALESALHTRAQACADAATAHAAREIIKAHPARSPERAALRNLPVEQVWVNASADVRATFDLKGTVKDAVDNCADRNAFTAAETAAVAALTLLPVAAPLPAFDGPLGEIVLATLIAGFVVHRITEGKGTPKFPSGHIRAAMAAAGGAAVDATGELVRGQDGMPVTTSGGPWVGNVGMTTGPAGVRPLMDTATGAGLDWRWEWAHSFFGVPETPFPPHVALDGESYDAPSDVPGGMFPGDHRGCRCALVPVLVPIEARRVMT